MEDSRYEEKKEVESIEEQTRLKRIIWFGISTRWQQHLNLSVVAFMQVFLAIIFSTPISSLYLFVTSHSQTNLSENSVDWQGLGQSDAFYSLTITLYGVGILLTSIVLTCIPHQRCFRVLMLFSFTIFITHGLIYMNAYHPWMIATSHCLLGAGFGISEVILISYISVASKSLPSNPKAISKSSSFSTKDRYLAVTLISKTIGWPIGLGIATLMSQFPNTIDQFRWPGWINAAAIGLYATLFLLLFRRVESNKECEKLTADKEDRCSSLRSKLKHLWDSKYLSFKKMKLSNTIVFIYLAFCGQVIGSLGSILGTVVPPILSDHFGFNITFVSYFTLIVMVTSFMGGGILVTLKCLRVNNRLVFGIVLLVGLAGTILASDWQALGQDSCTIDTGSSNTTYEMEQIHEALPDLCSSQNEDCHWNQYSVLTGSFCLMCRPVCRSKSKTINVIQFCLAVVMIHLTGLVGWTILVGMATDCTPHKLQSAIVGLLFMMSGVAFLVTPLWSIAIYDVSGRRSFAPMSVWGALQVVCLVGLALLYKLLGPTSKVTAQTVRN